MATEVATSSEEELGELSSDPSLELELSLELDSELERELELETMGFDACLDKPPVLLLVRVKPRLKRDGFELRFTLLMPPWTPFLGFFVGPSGDLNAIPRSMSMMEVGRGATFILFRSAAK